MTEDFFDAHERHWDDAQQLYDVQRWANADHLYGLSAECGLKWLMEKFQDTSINQSQKKHINFVWVIYETVRSGHNIGTQFVLPSNNPFNNWDIGQRYAPKNAVNQAITDPHQQAAKIISGLVTKAYLEGLI